MEQTSLRDISILEHSWSCSWMFSWALLDFFLVTFLQGVSASSTGSGGKMLGFDIVPENVYKIEVCFISAQFLFTRFILDYKFSL